MAALPLAPRPQDRPLRDDVRRLGAALGRVVLRLEGREAYNAVESLRKACRARRRGEAGAKALGELLAQVDALPLATARVVARAFTLFFLLINTAEQVHRLRRRRAYARRIGAPQPASPAWTLARLREAGHSAAEVREALERVEVRPVLTAHPTEATRRTLLGLLARVGDALLEREFRSDEDRGRLDAALAAELELLWLTAEVRNDRPGVLDEVSTMLWYLSDRLLPASGHMAASFGEAFAEVYGGDAPPPKLRVGSWVGGDRDGNPFVTPDITRAACRRAAFVALGHFEGRVSELVDRLSLSSRLAPPGERLRASIEHDRQALPAIWEANRRRDADEPLRLKLSFMRARLAASREAVAARDAGRHAQPGGAAYEGPQAFVRDLELVREELEAAGASRAARALVDPVLAEVSSFGFHGLRLDLREDASAHTAALDSVAVAAGLAPLDGEALRRELLGRRPLTGAHMPLDEGARKALEFFRAVDEIQTELGPDAASTYIVSMAREADDLLRVLLLAREAGLVDLAASPPRSRLDVVPLFETHDDLVRAPDVLRGLFKEPAWQRQLEARGRRQEVMIGYSDSAKDVGILPASWALYRVQEELGRVFDEAGVALTLFHGQGGTVGRGGGSPVYRALTALPPGSTRSGLKITEQGEVISQKFGLMPLAERSLEVLVSGTLLANFEDWRGRLGPGEEARFREVMARLADVALPAFRARVHDDPSLFRFFLETTPVRELAHVHFGSRPAYRDRGGGTMRGIRAIPWQFGWTQVRLMLPAWLGVGTALSAVLAEPGGQETLSRMAALWPFFDDLIAKIEMVCMKADLDVTRAYVTALGGDAALFGELEAEFERTVSALQAVRGGSLGGTASAVLRASIALRNPYVDALNLLQISLLGRKRREGPGADLGALDQALGTTLNGVAQGLRNTG